MSKKRISHGKKILDKIDGKFICLGKTSIQGKNRKNHSKKKKKIVQKNTFKAKAMTQIKHPQNNETPDPFLNSIEETLA